MTRPAPELAEALDGLSDPILVVSPEARVAFANRAARRELGEIEGREVAAPPEAAEADPRAFLRRCLGAAEPLIGGLALRGGEGVIRLQCFGSRLLLEGSPHVLLRLRHGADPRFAALSRKIDELNAEIRRRRESEAALAAALAERDLLLRELQHRVKNNLHMLVGLLKTAAREAAGAEARAALQEVGQRVAAVAAAQQLLYQLDRLHAVEAPGFIETVAYAALALAENGVRLELAVEPLDVANDRAAPLALILNELVTNAIKHGRPASGGGRILVELRRSGDRLTLAVTDEGPGFQWSGTAGRRASGLGLVQGLARQLDGVFSVERAEPGGSRCVVRFAHGLRDGTRTEAG